MRTRLITPFILLVVAGCASSPTAIQPDDVSAELYADFSCETLREMRTEKDTEIAKLSKSQKNKRVVDGFSNVLLLPGVASIVRDSSKPLARAKGEKNAMIREYDRRCIRRAVDLETPSADDAI